MRRAIPIHLSSEEMTLLEQVVRSGKSPQRQVERSRVVLLAAEGRTNEQIGAQLGITRQKAARWRSRFAAHRLEGIRADRPGRGRKAIITPEQRMAVVQRTTQETPPGHTHWSVRTMAKATGLGATTIREIWRTHGLKPHLARTFKVSSDPHFAEKLEDIVGLYMSPPEHALVLCCDEKSQVQALDTTERVHELARMLGGSASSSTSLAHAREMLEAGGISPLAGRRIVLGVSAGIAAYKAVEICRRMVADEQAGQRGIRFEPNVAVLDRTLHRLVEKNPIVAIESLILILTAPEEDGSDGGEGVKLGSVVHGCLRVVFVQAMSGIVLATQRLRYR